MNSKKCKQLRRGIRKLMPKLAGQAPKYKFAEGSIRLSSCFRKVYQEAKSALRAGRFTEVNAILALGAKR